MVVLLSDIFCGRWNCCKRSGKPISYTILLLLFLLGISVGANDAIVDNLTTLGGQAFLIALAGTSGSVLAAWGVYHFFFKERRGE